MDEREGELLALLLTVTFLVSFVRFGSLFGGFADIFIFVFISTLGGGDVFVDFVGRNEFPTLEGGTATGAAELIVLEEEGEDDGYPSFRGGERAGKVEERLLGGGGRRDGRCFGVGIGCHDRSIV